MKPLICVLLNMLQWLFILFTHFCRLSTLWNTFLYLGYNIKGRFIFHFSPFHFLLLSPLNVLEFSCIRVFCIFNLCVFFTVRNIISRKFYVWVAASTIVFKRFTYGIRSHFKSWNESYIIYFLLMLDSCVFTVYFFTIWFAYFSLTAHDT